MIGGAGWWTQNASTTLLQPKNWSAHFCITFNFWWLAGLVIVLEQHPPPVSSQKKWNAHFWITFNFWWSARLVDELESHLQPLSNQKNEMLVFGLCSTSDDWPGWLMDSNPIHHPSPAKKMKCLFLDYFQFRVISQAGRWTRTPSTTPLQPNNAMLIFGLHSTSYDWPGWSMDSNPICNPSPTKKMKCSFLDYVQLLMIGQAGRRTQTPSATSFQPTKWNASFGIMFNFWWSAGLVDGLKPHLSPLSSQKNEMLVFALCSTSDDQLGWSMDSNPICHPFQAKKMKYSFLYCIQLLMIGLVIGLEHHPPALSSQKNEMLIFGLYLTSDDQPRWSMDSNPICHLSPGIKWNSHFCITFNLWWSSGLVMDSNPICHPSPAK